jgi:hypothetical protein
LAKAVSKSATNPKGSAVAFQLFFTSFKSGVADILI